MEKRTLTALNNLTAEDYLELTAYAQKRLSVLFRGGKIPEGRSGQDFVQEILRKVLDGIRNWNHNTTPDFKKFLFSSVKSEINNFACSKLCNSEIDIDFESDIDFWAALMDEENFLEKNLQSEIVDYVYNEICDIDENLGTLLLFDLEDYSADEIAKEMDITVKQVYNLRKRLKRYGVKIWEEHTKQETLK